MNRTALVVLLLLGSVTLSACSDDATGPGDELNAAERALLAQSLFAFGFDATVTDPSGVSGSDVGIDAVSQPKPPDVAFGLDLTVSCPLGGDVLIAGVLEGWVHGAGETALAVRVDQTHRGCIVRSGDGGVELRVDGEPGTSLSYDTYAIGDAFDVNGTLTGAVRWATGDRTGVCATDLSWSGAARVDGQVEFTVSGVVCGREVSTTFAGT